MKSVVTVACLAGLAMFLAGCSTMTPTSYAPNADNNVALKKITGSTFNVGSISDQSHFSPGCRLMGPIEASGKRSVAQFIQDSFNDEFKFAGAYGNSPTSVALSATLDHAEFSSTDSLTNGWWDLSATLTNTKTGKSVSAHNRYEFASGFDAMTACTQTAQALTPAVQGLIKDAVTKPEFAALVSQ